jgi:hypothetical protein
VNGLLYKSYGNTIISARCEKLNCVQNTYWKRSVQFHDGLAIFCGQIFINILMKWSSIFKEIVYLSFSLKKTGKTQRKTPFLVSFDRLKFLLLQTCFYYFWPISWSSPVNTLKRDIFHISRIIHILYHITAILSTNSCSKPEAIFVFEDNPEPVNVVNLKTCRSKRSRIHTVIQIFSKWIKRYSLKDIM